MKISYNAGKISVELEGDTQKDLFAQLSAFQEVFDESTCGKCGSALSQEKLMETVIMKSVVWIAVLD
jgi:hypothetical protein